MGQQLTEEFEGVALHERIPLCWQSADLENAVELDHAHQEALRVLQAMAVFEEAPKETSSDANQPGHELQHLETKLDVLLGLVGSLIAERGTGAQEHSVMLRAGSAEWTGPAANGLARGASGYLVLYVNPLLPLALRLPARVVGTAERNGARWLLTRFEHQTQALENAMEKLIFRRHRRQIALARGTGVPSQTGVFQVPKIEHTAPAPANSLTPPRQRRILSFLDR